MKSFTVGILITVFWFLPGAGSAQVTFGSSRMQPARVNPPVSRPNTNLPRTNQPTIRPDQGTLRPNIPGGLGSTIVGPVDLYRAGPRTYAPTFDRLSSPYGGRRQFMPGYGYYGYAGGAYLPSFAEPSYPSVRESNAEQYGYLRLHVYPGMAEVYVDGLYVGAVADFGDSKLVRLAAGPHRVEIGAPGFETLTFDVRISANETITYRRDLGRVETRVESSPPQAAAAIPKTFYVIPRCYAGDSRPRQELLPPGCRVSDVRTVPPLVARAR